MLRQRREPDEIGEQHGHQAALGQTLRGAVPADTSPAWVADRRGRGVAAERRAALAAETLSGDVDGVARGALQLERNTALRAEPPPGPVLRTT